MTKYEYDLKLVWEMYVYTGHPFRPTFSCSFMSAMF